MSKLLCVNFLEYNMSIEDVDKIFSSVNYKKCLLIKGKKNIIIGKREHIFDNFSGSTGFCIYS